MHNLPPVIGRAGWRMDMESSAWSQSPTCQNAKLTIYDWQSRMKNGHRIITMITVTNMLECTTHPLWLAEQDEEWTWNHQHGHGHQHARMPNSPPMIGRARWRIDMESSVWSQSPTCQIVQLTHYDWQSGDLHQTSLMHGSWVLVLVLV